MYVKHNPWNYETRLLIQKKTRCVSFGSGYGRRGPYFKKNVLYISLIWNCEKIHISSCTIQYNIPFIREKIPSFLIKRFLFPVFFQLLKSVDAKIKARGRNAGDNWFWAPVSLYFFWLVTLHNIRYYLFYYRYVAEVNLSVVLDNHNIGQSHNVSFAHDSPFVCYIISSYWTDRMVTMESSLVEFWKQVIDLCYRNCKCPHV